MRKLVARESFLKKNKTKHSFKHNSQRLYYNFDFQLKTKIVDKMIKEVEFKLIFIDDYFDVQFKIRTKKEVKENLSFFLFLN